MERERESRGMGNEEMYWEQERARGEDRATKFNLKKIQIQRWFCKNRF